MSIYTFEVTHKQQHIRLGDLPDSEIAEILWHHDLLESCSDETSFCEKSVPSITLSEEELNLFYEIVDGLVGGEMTYGHAVILTAMYACAVEDRVLKIH